MITTRNCRHMTDPEILDDTTESEDGDHQLAVVSADRSDAEMQEAYQVEWRSPGNEQSLADRVRDWL